MRIEEMMQAVLAANPAKRRSIEAILNGKQSVPKPINEEDSRLVSVSGAARLLAVGRTTVYKLIKQGRLETIKMIGSQKITMRSIQSFLDGNREEK